MLGTSALYSRSKARASRYHPILAQIKKDQSSNRDSRLSATLTELVFESIRIIERFNPTNNIFLESKYGRELVTGGRNRLETNIQTWIPGNLNLFLTCATELGWVIDNYFCLGAENLALSCDAMNGFFIGPRSAAQLVDHLFACVCFTNRDTEPGRESRSQLLTSSLALHFERHERLVGQLKRARNFLSDAKKVLIDLGGGPHHLQAILERFPSPSIEKGCREALIITAAARMGMTFLGEEQLVTAAELLDRQVDHMSGTTIIGPGIVPRRLWDCLLPYVAVDKNGHTLRGTVDQQDWLVTESYSGVAAGFHRLYGSSIAINEDINPIGVVREGHRLTLDGMDPSEMATLQWLIWSPESPLDNVYHQLREIAHRGHGPRSRACAHAWLNLCNQVSSVDPKFVERYFKGSMTLALGAVSLVAAAAETSVDFREGLLTRVVATFSCEDCRIETRNGDCIVLARDIEGNVTISSAGAPVGELLMEIAARIDRHCTSRGTKVRSDLGYLTVKTKIPDFVQSMSVETFTPAVWINLVHINTP